MCDGAYVLWAKMLSVQIHDDDDDPRMLTLSSITRMVFVQFGARALGTPSVYYFARRRALHAQNNLTQTRIDYMAAVRTRKAPWTFCLGAEVLAKDAEGVEFFATFEVAETMVYNGQTVYTGYYVRRGVDRVLVFVSIGRLQSLQGCPERKAWKNDSSGQRSMLLFLGAFILVWYIPPYIHVSIAFVYEMSKGRAGGRSGIKLRINSAYYYNARARALYDQNNLTRTIFLQHGGKTSKESALGLLSRGTSFREGCEGDIVSGDF
ncbi:hypothetical protein BDN70DRAFT_899192 [Pholiota conissans]|uniref:Uncharacterized protein n=1 Tax=Pholiota conissans TaxID=109636 RepID=A0A9P5YUR5_9AGAR|nr:hypothetical protein BDN70DRAFT_899192 [Pholiota conissans]